MKRTNGIQYDGASNEPVILLVNRNQRNLDLLTSFLKREGYDTATASNREEFEQVLRKPYDIGATLFDIAGFDSSIWEQCGQLSSKEIPFVIIAPSRSAAIQQASIAYGAKDVVVKPLALNDVRSILDRLLEESERKKLEERQRQAQKMEMLGSLTSGIVHDFNNILTAIRVSTDHCLSQVSPQHALYPYMSRIRENTERAIRLSRQLLSFARQQPLALKQINMNEVITSLHDLLKTILGERITIKFHLDPAIQPIMADKTQVEQVVLNLCMNARDAMPEGGNLDIATHHAFVEQADISQHPGSQPGPYILLTVKDSGMGMDEQVQARLFEPFFTTKGPGKGTGLGLSVVYGIVGQHHGFIDVDSAVGHGTTFSIYWPAYEQEVIPEATPQIHLEVAPEQYDGHGASLSSVTLLLVEDDTDLRLLMREVLEEEGYTVLLAQNAEEGLQIFKEHASSIALVVSDFQLPGMQGKDLYEQIRQIEPSVRFLFASGYDEGHLKQALPPGATVTILPKPFDVHDLTAKVSMLTGRSNKT